MSAFSLAKAAARVSVGLVCIYTGAVTAQPFGPGPAGDVVGSSMAGARIGGAPAPVAPRIEGAKVFGDTVTERAYGRDYDDSYLRPVVPNDTNAGSSQARAIEGRSTLGQVGAGIYAREGVGAIGSSAVTRGEASTARPVIVPRPTPAPR